jgi:hypothetical protein
MSRIDVKRPCTSQPPTSQLGGERAYKGRSGRTGVRAIPRIEAAFARIATLHAFRAPAIAIVVIILLSN